MRTTRLNSHYSLGDRMKQSRAAELKRTAALPDWSTVRSPPKVLGLHLPQDVETSVALAAVRQKIAEACTKYDAQIFELVIEGREENFAWLQFAARHAGLVLIPDAPKGSKPDLRSWPR